MAPWLGSKEQLEPQEELELARLKHAEWLRKALAPSTDTVRISAEEFEKRTSEPQWWKCLRGEHEAADCGIPREEIEGLDGLVYVCKHCRCLYVEGKA